MNDILNNLEDIVKSTNLTLVDIIQLLSDNSYKPGELPGANVNFWFYRAIEDGSLGTFKFLHQYIDPEGFKHNSDDYLLEAFLLHRRDIAQYIYDQGGRIKKMEALKENKSSSPSSTEWYQQKRREKEERYPSPPRQERSSHRNINNLHSLSKRVGSSIRQVVDYLTPEEEDEMIYMGNEINAMNSYSMYPNYYYS